MSTNNERIDKFKKIVDEIFSRLDKIEQESPPVINRGNKQRKLNFEKLEALREKENVSDDAANTALEYALDELDELREAFLEFQEQIQDLAIFQFIYPQIEQFVEFCLDLVELVEDEFDVNSLEGKALEQYQKMQKLRARILSAMYMKYKKGDK